MGDGKMAALATRAVVEAGKDFYLCPLSETQLNRAQRQELLQGVWEGRQPLHPVHRPGPEGQPQECVAEGLAVDVELNATGDGSPICWTERRWLVRSLAYAQAQEATLEQRLTKADVALRELVCRKQGKKPLFHAELVQAAQAIVSRHGVDGLLRYTIQTRMRTRQVRAYRGQAARQETEIFFEIEGSRDESGIEQKKREMGWQVYATNSMTMALAQVVWAYRGQYRIEDDWSRLKGRSLGLTPLYLQDEKRVQGLVHLLSLGLRMLTLLEWEVRERLRQKKETLQEVYAGQPGRKTSRPSAELLLGVMKTISISVVEVHGEIHVLLSPLSKVQQRILGLWGLPVDLYEKVAREFPKPPPKGSEP